MKKTKPKMKRVPVAAAKRVNDAYGYDITVLVTWKNGVGGYIATYGTNKQNCDWAAQLGSLIDSEVISRDFVAERKAMDAIATSLENSSKTVGEITEQVKDLVEDLKEIL